MVFYKSFFDAINNVPDHETQLQVYRAIFEFSLLEQEPELEGLAYTLFILIKPQLQANLKRREDGKKGGRPKTIGFKNENHRLSEEKTNGYENEKPNVNENVNVNVNDNANLFEEIFNTYNEQTNLPKSRVLTKNRIDILKRLLEAFTKEEIIEVFEKANNVPWLTGKNDKGWRADFDWLINIDNFVRVQDGRYDNLSIEKPKGYISGNYDFDALEREARMN